MSELLRPYQPRLIGAVGVVEIADWRIKLYTLTYREVFSADTTLNAARRHLPGWIAGSAQDEFASHQLGFLIVHEGTDGIWTLFNYWTGGEILRGQTYFSSPETPDQFAPRPHHGFMACVWEMAILDFERRAWIASMLRPEPDRAEYLTATIEGKC